MESLILKFLLVLVTCYNTLYERWRKKFKVFVHVLRYETRTFRPVVAAIGSGVIYTKLNIKHKTMNANLKAEGRELLHQAINKWGVDAQIEMIIEECLELAVALQKLKRKRGDHEQKLVAVIDEIADVRIIIEQAIIIFADPDNKIQQRIDFKMNRLSERLSESFT